MNSKPFEQMQRGAPRATAPPEQRIVLPPSSAQDPLDRLIGFRFGGAAAEPGVIALGATLLRARGPMLEDWLCAGPVTTASAGAVHLRTAADYAAVHTTVDEAAPIADATESAYRQLLSTLSAAGYPVLMRTWNFIPAINAGDDDAERYRQFCLGRGRALDASGIAEGALPAGTAIGLGADEPLCLALLATRIPVTHVENPRQTSAFCYPRQYGPRSPSFARATLLRPEDGAPLLLASGTASIRGHESLHSGNLHAQIAETLANLESLIATAADIEPRLPRRVGAESMLRIYLRHDAFADEVLGWLARTLPATPATLLRADICRRELDIEMEAVVRP